MDLCTATIYRALKDSLLSTVLRQALRQKGKRRKAESEECTGTIPDCISKGERPTEAAARSRAGDWKGDIVAEKWRTECLMTLVDRKAWFLVGKKLNDHRTETLKESICNSLEVLSRHTLMVDNGKEFAAHKAITTELKAQTHFSYPHSP
jgi:IS30 family transposase